MKPTPELDRIFPLSVGSSERARLRPPPLLPTAKELPGSVMTDHSYVWAWTGRRAVLGDAGFSAPSVGHLRCDPLSALHESSDEADRANS